MGQWSITGYLRKYVRQYASLFVLAIAFLTVEAMCDLFQPAIMSKIVDVGIAGRNLAYVLKTGGVMLAVTAVGAVGAVGRNNISSRVSQRFGAQLRRDLFVHVHSLSYDSMDQFDTGSLLTRLTNDVNQLQNFFNGLMRIFVKAPLFFIGSVIMAVIMSPRMSVILLAVIPVILIIVLLGSRSSLPYFKRVQKAIDRLNGTTQEYLAGIRVVKAFNRFDYEKDRFDQSNTTMAQIQTTAMRIMALFSPLVTLAVNISIIIVLMIGGYGVNSGSVQVGKVIAFTNYMVQISGSLMTISMAFVALVRAKASAERIGEVMDTRNTIAKAGNPQKLSCAGNIEFDNVSFSYGGEKVLDSVGFSCKSGETIGIIGSTGSGKTTLINLIPRFYDVASGTVRINGLDIREYDEQELRKRIAVVPQKNMLFSGTLAENIRWGKSDASGAEIEDVAKAAQAYEFIAAMPDGFSTMVGQGGVNLSGGQKQRVSIARALLKNPDILILDDCTSAVDAITEAKIRRGLRAYSKDLICIVIAQRVSAVMSASRILVLDGGRVAGIGNHAGLMESCEVYREIYLSQYGGKKEAN